LFKKREILLQIHRSVTSCKQENLIYFGLRGSGTFSNDTGQCKREALKISAPVMSQVFQYFPFSSQCSPLLIC